MNSPVLLTHTDYPVPIQGSERTRNRQLFVVYEDESNLRTRRVLMRQKRRKQGRPFVFKPFDIFKHHKGLGTVDKIKKYRRDSPSVMFTHLGR